MERKTFFKKTLSKEWSKILPVKGKPKMRYVKDDDTDWIFETLGWKEK